MSRCGARSRACRVETRLDTSAGATASSAGVAKSGDAARRSACATLALWSIGLLGCGHAGPALEVFKTVPDFTLTASSGSPFQYSAQLKGKVWVADFMFTTCAGPCPRLSTQMRHVQAALSVLPQVKLVSFTVDPANDTPEVLAAYAKRYAADPARWFFLTGPPTTLQMLSMDTFMLSKVDAQMDHSTRIVLVDQQGRVRKYYATSEGFQIPDLVLDVKRLLKEQRALAAPPNSGRTQVSRSRRAAPFCAGHMRAQRALAAPPNSGRTQVSRSRRAAPSCAVQIQDRS